MCDSRWSAKPLEGFGDQNLMFCVNRAFSNENSDVFQMFAMRFRKEIMTSKLSQNEGFPTRTNFELNHRVRRGGDISNKVFFWVSSSVNWTKLHKNCILPMLFKSGIKKPNAISERAMEHICPRRRKNQHFSRFDHYVIKKFENVQTTQ